MHAMPSGLTGPSQSIKSVFQGLHALGPAWGNHLDGDGACRKPSGPLSSYCRSILRNPYQVPPPSSSPVPSTWDRRTGALPYPYPRPAGRLTTYNAVPSGLMHHIACIYTGPQAGGA